MKSVLNFLAVVMVVGSSVAALAAPQPLTMNQDLNRIVLSVTNFRAILVATGTSANSPSFRRSFLVNGGRLELLASLQKNQPRSADLSTAPDAFHMNIALASGRARSKIFRLNFLNQRESAVGTRVLTYALPVSLPTVNGRLFARVNQVRDAQTQAWHSTYTTLDLSN